MVGLRHICMGPSFGAVKPAECHAVSDIEFAPGSSGCFIPGFCVRFFYVLLFALFLFRFLLFACFYSCSCVTCFDPACLLSSSPALFVLCLLFSFQLRMAA